MLLDEDAAGAPSGCRHERILVARSANLGLAPWLRVAAGLIVEVGGVLAHAACNEASDRLTIGSSRYHRWVRRVIHGKISKFIRRDVFRHNPT